jgi:hypothetical protein
LPACSPSLPPNTFNHPPTLPSALALIPPLTLAIAAVLHRQLATGKDLFVEHGTMGRSRVQKVTIVGGSGEPRAPIRNPLLVGPSSKDRAARTEQQGKARVLVPMSEGSLSHTWLLLDLQEEGGERRVWRLDVDPMCRQLGVDAPFAVRGKWRWG